MVQTHWVVERLHRLWPNLEILIEQIHTTGDRVTNVPLSQIGGDGVFVTEIERALHEHRIDLAVHSLKDLPTAQPEGLDVVVMGPREDVRDVFISNVPFRLTSQGLQPCSPDAQLEKTLRIGTSSLRRTAQIQAFFPSAQLLPIRGNVDTRLRKLAAGDYDGIVLASAGLHRLDILQGLADKVIYFPVEMLLPAPGQGALGLEIRDTPEFKALLAPLRDNAAQATTSAERMFMRRLGAGCYLPIAAYGSIEQGMLTLRGLVISLDGQQQISVHQSIPWTATSSIEQAEQLGINLADEALIRGASKIIEEINGIREGQHV
jgi:hydroxymethylbilane synthase